MACDLGFRPSGNPNYFFLSYNTEDADRVREIAMQLSQNGIELWYDKAIEYGEKWERTIAEKIHSSQAVILFFSRGILHKVDSYVEKEYSMAQRFGRRIYVVMLDNIDDGEVPPGKMPWWDAIRALQCIEAHVISDSHSIVKEIIMTLVTRRDYVMGIMGNAADNIELHSSYDANISASVLTLPTTKRNWSKCLNSYIPLEPKVGLIGRDDVVNKVRTMLDSHKNIALVSGLGGIGKTAVMAQICNDIITENNKDTYVAWIKCGASYVDDLLVLRQSLGVPKGLKRDEAYNEVVGKLKNLYGTLYLFLDDMVRVPDENELATYNTLRPNVRIMITSRHKIEGIPHVDLQELKKDSVIKMFYDYYGKDKEQKYVSESWWIINSDPVRSHTQLVELLAKAAYAFYGRLPEFWRKLEEKGYLDVSRRRFDSGRFVNNTIREIVIQLYDVSDLSEEQRRIMRLFSIFTAEKVIYGAVEEWAGLNEDEVDGLVRLGWLVRAENGFVIRQIVKDSLVEQVGRNLKMEDYGDLLDKVIETDEYMPRNLEYTEVQERLGLTFDVARYLWTRTKGLLELGNCQEKDSRILTGAGTLFNNIAGVFQAQGDYKKALEYYEKALSIREQVLGLEHPDTATTYNDMALVYLDKGDYARALEYCEKALLIQERALGSEHLDTAATYNNIAGAYEAQGEYEKALEYYGKALEIKERVLGPEHPSTATTYNNMALVYLAQDEYWKAQEYNGKALAICERVLGLEHPSTATAYDNMALVYYAQGAYGKAQEYNGKSLSIRERVLGPEHPDTASTYNNMALVYLAQGEYGKAQEYNGKALSIRERVLGPEHQDTATTYNNMALVYSAQGEYGKALEYNGKALSIRERVLGPEHQDTATTYSNMAFVFRAQGDYEKALEYFAKALAVLKQRLGINHPNTQFVVKMITTVNAHL